MLTRNLSILLAAGVLILGIAIPAGAKEKGKTIRSEEQVRIAFQARSGGPAEEKTAGDQTITQDRTQTRDRFRDGTGDHDPDRDQYHDRIRDHQGMGGCMGGDCMGSGGMGAGGMGGGMRGPRR